MVLPPISSILNLALREVLLTKGEYGAMLGLHYANELERYFH